MNMLILSLGIFYFFDAKSKNSFISDNNTPLSYLPVSLQFWDDCDTQEILKT